ncbi:MAG TPA: ABC transporter substrate-binding protein [Longimicrobiaceae bacterium]|nr:ABC transporter substrate-binding protein [Longimicrobiaceae bacterium]
MQLLRPLRSAALLVCAFLAAACGRGPGGDPLVLGLAAPLGESFGENSRLAAELAVREINDAGGIEGRRLELRPADDRSDPAEGIRVAQAFLEDPEVLAVVGHATSDPMIAGSTVYAQGLPVVGTSATSTEVARLGPWVFRVASSDSANAVELADAARALGRRVGILYSNDRYGRSLARVFDAALTRSGVPVVGFDPYQEEMEDFRPYLRRLRERGAEVVLVAGLETGASRAIAQAREVGLQARFIGGDGLEPLAGMGPEYEGTLVGTLFHPDAGERSRRFAEAFRRAFGREPDSSAATSYDAVYLIAGALRAGSRDRAAIRAYLEGVGRPGGAPAFEGVTGRVAFDENGDPVDKDFPVTEVSGGKLVLVRAGS